MAWSATPNTENPFKMWGYIENPDGSPAPYPRIRVTDQSGNAYGNLYVGDGGGVFAFAIPSSEYEVEVMTNGNKTWKGKAYMIVGGHTRMVAGEGVTTQTPQGSPSSSDGSGKTWIWVAAAAAGGLGLAVYKKWIKVPKFLKGKR